MTKQLTLLALAFPALMFTACESEEEQAQKRRDEWIAEASVTFDYSDRDENLYVTDVAPGSVEIKPSGTITFNYGSSAIDNELFTEKIEIIRETAGGTTTCEIEEGVPRDEKVGAYNYGEVVRTPTKYTVRFTATDGTTTEFGPWDVTFSGEQEIATCGFGLNLESSGGGTTVASSTNRLLGGEYNFIYSPSISFIELNPRIIDFGFGEKDGKYYLVSPDEFINYNILPEIAGRCELQTVRFALYNDTFDLQDESTLNTYEELAALDLTGASKVLEITDSLTYVVFQFDQGQKGIAQVNRKTVSSSDLTVVGVGFTGRLQR